MSDYRAQLLETLRKPGIFDLDTAELFDQLLVQPLTILKIDGGHETLCVILDGLDECSEGEKNTVVEVLGKCVKKFPVWMRVLITARRDTSVLEWIAPDRLIDLSDHDDQNTEDVRVYLQQALAEKTFASDKEKDKVISRLTERSGGSFLFAFLIAQAILEGLIDPLDEDMIPDKLGKTFLLWMRRSFGGLEEYRNVFRAPLSVIISSPEPLPAEELLRLLNMSETELRDFKRRMNAFFTEGSDAFGEKTLRFEHKYISDWLAGEEAGPFSVSRRDGLKILAVRCWEQFQKEESELSGYEVVWLQKLLKQAGMTKELETVNTSTLFFDRLCNLSDQCINWGKYKTAEKLCGNMLENALARTTVLQEVDNGEEPSEEILAANTDLMKSYIRMAEICMDMGEADEAFELYEKSLAIARSLNEKLSTNDTHRQVAICYGTIAGIHIYKGRLDEAYDILQKCCAVHEELARKEETPQSLAQLARIYQKIADIHRMKEEFAEALELYERVLQMRETINEEICSSETRNDISVSCERIADVLKKTGKWEKALAYYERGVSIMEQLIEKQRTPKMLCGLMLCTSKIADIYMDEKDIDHALQLYERCYVINQEIAQKLETPKAKLDLSVSCDRIADIHKAKGNLEMAMKLYQKSLSIREELSEKLGTINLLWNLCVSQYEIAECLKAGEEYEKALPYYQKACEICDRISDILPVYSRYKEIMGEAFEKCRQLCIEE